MHRERDLIERLDALGQLLLTLASLMTFVPSVIQAAVNDLFAYSLLPSLVISSLAMPIYVGYWRGTMQGNPREAVRGMIYLIYGTFPAIFLTLLLRCLQPPFSLGIYWSVLLAVVLFSLFMVFSNFPIASIEGYLGIASDVLGVGLLDKFWNDYRALTIVAAAGLSIGTTVLGISLWLWALGIPESFMWVVGRMALAFLLFVLFEYFARHAGTP